MSHEMEQRRHPETGLPVITTPGDRRDGNGKRWWQEVWGKVTAGLLLIAIPAASAWVYFKAVAAYDATAEVYRMPPIVARHEAELKALRTKPPMTDEQVKELARKLAEALRSPEPRKGRP